MSFVFEDDLCPLCNEALDRPFLATSGCAFPQNHRLWRYCGAALHVDCLQDWADRGEFCSAYYKQRLDQYQREKWFVLATGNGWFCGKALPYPGSVFADHDDKLVEVRVEDWPITFLVNANRWTEFVDGEWCSLGPQLHGYALARAQVIIAEARQLVPNTTSLFRLIARHENAPATSGPQMRTTALRAPAGVIARSLFAEFVDKPLARHELLSRHKNSVHAIQAKMKLYQFASLLVAIIAAEQTNGAFASVREHLERLFLPSTLSEGSEKLEILRTAMVKIAELIEPEEDLKLVGWSYNWLRTIGVSETDSDTLASFAVEWARHHVAVANALREFQMNP